MTYFFCLLKGGLGNQLFQYSAASYIYHKWPVALIIDTKSGFLFDFKFKRKFALNHFNLKGSLFDAHIVIHFIFLLLYKIIKKFRHIKEIFGIYVVGDYNISELFKFGYGTKKIIILDGYFQSFLFANDKNLSIFKSHDYYSSFLLESSLKKRILSCSSVCLHLRHYDEDSSSRVHEVKEFYIKAVGILRHKIAKPMFFVFSDTTDFDISFLNLSSNEVVLVDSDKSVDPISDIYLMSLCKYFIFTGSTFCYWSIYLSNDFKENVICSSLILRDKHQCSNLPFYPSNWFLI